MRDTLIKDTATRIFEDAANRQTSQDDLWSTLSDNGLTTAWAPDDLGGAGVTLLDGYDIVRVSGQFAADVPIAETLLSARLLALIGQSAPQGRWTVVPVRTPAVRPAIRDGDARETMTRFRAVPFAADCDMLLLAQSNGHLVGVPAAHLTTHPRTNDTGARRADVVCDCAQAQRLDTISMPESCGGFTRLALEGAIVRTVQMTGALETMLHMTVTYAQQREAFGRRIGKFQAVQQQLAVMAGEIAAAITASGSAAEAMASGLDANEELLLEVASAKVRVCEAADTAMAIAHQVHGAIGVTNDYALQRYSRALIGWREDFGAAAVWAESLGRVVAKRGGFGLWPFLTTR